METTQLTPMEFESSNGTLLVNEDGSINENSDFDNCSWLSDISKIDIEELDNYYKLQGLGRCEGGDESNFDLEVEDNLLNKIFLAIDEESFRNFLSETYSSRDGFWSFTPNTPEGLLEKMKEDPERCWGAVFSFLVDGYLEECEGLYNYIEDFQEELSSHNSYLDFVDMTEFEDFKNEICPIIDKGWKKEIFIRDFNKDKEHSRVIQDGYNKGKSAEDVAESLMESLEEEFDVPVDVVIEVVKETFNKIESHTLKLDL